ncbi:MAG: LuxR family transcriptional regulator [Magnetospirillum gryphiswaldense]|nr:LuxR family transcriptional regulator [Magnetospirillum gryphiswaldense]
MDSWIMEMTEELLWVEDIPSAQATLRKLAKDAQADFFAYGNSRPGMETPYWDSTYPAPWMDHYFLNRYQFIDPVVIEAQRSHLPFAWRFLLNRPEGLTPEQKLLFSEAAEYGIRDGFTIPFHTENGCIAAMSFAFRSRAEMEHFATLQPRLKLLALYYHTAIERLLEVALPPNDLSPLEQQCLSAVAGGRSLWEISGLLHRTESDVTASLRSARDKLGAATTAQAINQAIAQGLISL